MPRSVPEPVMRERLARLLRGDLRRLIGLCVAINLAILAGIALRYPAYLSDYRLNDSPDARHYVLLGRNLLLEGHYSRMDAPPYDPDFLRTPVYPVLAGALDVVTGPLGLYLLQIAVQVAALVLLYRLARRYFGPRAAFWAGLLAATDLMSTTYNFSALTEPLFSLFVLLALTLLLPRLVPARDPPPDRPGAWVLGGLALALATLTRPAGLYLPLLAAVAALWLVGRRAGWRPAVRAAGLVLVPSLLLVGGWIARNERLFGVARVSSVDAVGTVHMAGAGAYQLHHGVERPEAQAMIVEEFGVPTLLEVQNPWLTELDEREIDARLRAAGPEILARYPGDLIRSSVLGLIKGSLSHNVPALAYLHGREWTPPGLGELARLRGAALRRLASNHPALIGAFFWQIGHALATLLLAAIGLWRLALSSEHRRLLLLVVVVLAYFGAGMALFGVDAYYRSRMPLLPLLFLLGGVGAASSIPKRTSRPG